MTLTFAFMTLKTYSACVRFRFKSLQLFETAHNDAGDILLTYPHKRVILYIYIFIHQNGSQKKKKKKIHTYKNIQQTETKAEIKNKHMHNMHKG